MRAADGKRVRVHIFVITEPAATYAPSPIVTGATRVELLPTKTLSPMLVCVLLIAIVVAGDGARADI